MGKPERKGPLTRPICWCVDNIKMNLRMMGWNGTDCIDLAQKGSRDHGNETSDSIKFCGVVE
jgi:hypothetical protein